MMEGITWETEEVELKQVFQTTAVTEKKKKVTWCIAWRLSAPVSRSSHESCTMRRSATWHLDVVSRDSIQGLAAC